MTPEQALSHYDSRGAIATVTDVTETAVGFWFRQGWIPYDKQVTLEHDSRSKLKASWLDLPDDRRPKHLRTAAV